MMKKLPIILIAVSAITFIKAQTGYIGINTPSPTTTLEVVGQPTNPSTLDGVILPKLTGDQLSAKTYSTAQTGAMVYITTAVSSLAGQVINVNMAGYYYFDGAVWQKVSTGNNPSANIYNADGAISNAVRTVDLGNNILNFTSGVGKIGLRTTSPLGLFGTASASITNSTGTPLSPFQGFGWTANTSASTAYAAMIYNAATTNGGGLLVKSSTVSGTVPVFEVATGTASNTNNTGVTNSASSLFSVLPDGKVGINNSTPSEKLDVTGNVKFSGALMPNNTAGTVGQVLMSNGANAAPNWQALSTITGTIAGVYYAQGTTQTNVNQGSTVDVPGASVTITVPAGKTQTLLFTITGYAVMPVISAGQASQGVFSLLQNGTKISSAYVSAGDGGSLLNLPSPSTFLKSVTLSSGTYQFKVQYSAWANNQVVNYVPSAFLGYNGDTEAMLTKMQVLVYNN